MRWLTFLFLCVVAVVLAVLILRRVRRGKPMVLAGRWSPRLVRMIVVVLVVLGVGDEARPPEASAAPLRLPIRSADDQLPPTLTAHAVDTWLSVHREGWVYDAGKKDLARLLAGGKPTAAQLTAADAHLRYLPARLQNLVRADLTAAAAGKPAPKPAAAADLRAALDELERAGRYDHFWNAYLWRRSAAADFPGPAARVELYARFRRHARVTDALIRAHARVKPPTQSPRAWMSKAGPRPAERAAMKAFRASLGDLVQVAAEVLPRTDEGTWKRDGVARFKPVPGAPAPVLVRGGRERVLQADEPTWFGRLDLFRTGEKPAVVAHDWLGKVELPANKLISVWELPDLLPDAAKQKLDETVHEALKSNSEDAADRLERCLAVSHRAIRAGLKELPNAKGAPRLRLILALFDDTVMPPLPNYQADPAENGLGRFGGR